MAKPSVKQLEYILALARYGSFRRAADELAISQPTLTAQIARAEKTLGVTLFERTRRGAALTPAGRRLEIIIRRILETLDDLVESADSARTGGSGVYRLGVAATLGPYVLPQILPACTLFTPISNSMSGRTRPESWNTGWSAAITISS